MAFISARGNCKNILPLDCARGISCSETVFCIALKVLTVYQLGNSLKLLSLSEVITLVVCSISLYFSM